MIMAGRGKRLDIGDDSKKISGLQETTDSTSVDVSLLTTKINEINLYNISPSLVNDIEDIFKNLFTSKEVMKTLISDMHNKSLDDAEFGEKFIVAIQQLLYFKIDDTIFRNELLGFIQKDFDMRKEMSYSNQKKFLNAVVLLGNVYNRIKVSGRPIAILAPALVEYLDLLLKGEDEELKTLVRQIVINGEKLSETDCYKQLMRSLRNTLINRNLSQSCKCWILLAIDFSSNNYQSLQDGVKDFYLTNLKDEFTKIEEEFQFFKIENDKLIHSPVSPDSSKSQDISPKYKKFNPSPRKPDGLKKDFSKKFSDMNVKSDNERKVQLPQGKNTRHENWKSSAGGRRSSGHDDRFDRHEDFYGVQKPRQPKAENLRQKFDDKSPIKEFDHFKAGTGENWN